MINKISILRSEHLLSKVPSQIVSLFELSPGVKYPLIISHESHLSPMYPLLQWHSPLELQGQSPSHEVLSLLVEPWILHEQAKNEDYYLPSIN